MIQVSHSPTTNKGAAMNRARRKRQNRKWARGLATKVVTEVFDTTPTVDLATVLNAMSIAQLVEYAGNAGIKVAARWRKPVIIAAIAGAESAQEVRG